MPWIAAIGAAVCAYVGVAAVSTMVAMVVGGAIVGAAVGALYTAVKGGNLGKNVLYGAIGGAVVGAGGAALGYGEAASATATSTTSTGLGTAGSGVTAESTTITTGAGNLAAPAATTTAGSTAGSTASELFASSQEWMGIGAVANMLGGFLSGSDKMSASQQLDAQKEQLDAQLAANKENLDKQLAAQRDIASSNNATTEEKIANDLAVSTAQLKQAQDQFNSTMDWNKFQYSDTNARTDKTKADNNAAITDASQYIQDSSKSPTVTQTNSRRKQLASPIWGNADQAQQQAAQTGQAAPLGQGILTQGAQNGTA